MYILEGNIGAGKSTLLQIISKYSPELYPIQEPVVNWQKQVHGQSLLADFYKDPKRWAYTMETFAMVNRVKEHLKVQSDLRNNNVIIERSIYSGHYCFAKNDYINGYLTELEWVLYNQWFNFLVNKKCKAPFGFIYLKTDTKIALERTRKRKRKEESGIAFDYLKQIDERHEEFLIQKEGILPELERVPILVLDGNLDFENNITIREEFLHAISQFMKSTHLIPAKAIYQERLEI